MSTNRQQNTGPNFICVGAQKAGTSWLCNQLRLHPKIWITPNKELHYFDRFEQYPSPNDLSIALVRERLKDEEWVRKAKKRMSNSIDTGYPSIIKWWCKYLFSNYSDEWYLSLFNCDAEKVSGELTPAYSILSEEDVKEMAILLPNTKIVFLMRNPVERAWSMLRFNEKRGEDLNLENIKELTREIDSEKQSLRSNYARTIDVYSSAFGKENLLIGFYDAISEQPEALLKEILSFLNIELEDPGIFNFSLVSNASPKNAMPPEIHSYLREKYVESILTMADTYGSYCQRWKDCLQGGKQASDGLRSPMAASFRASEI